MVLRIVTLLSLILLTICCSKEQNEQGITEGNYTGVYHSTYPAERLDWPAKLTLESDSFTIKVSPSEAQWSSLAGHPRYPEPGKVELYDELDLMDSFSDRSGVFNYTVQGRTLIISNSTKEVYTFKRD
jgi:hypothetical protein